MTTQATNAITPDVLKLACEIRESLRDRRPNLLELCLRLPDVQVERGVMPS